jgi:hypothetical protein
LFGGWPKLANPHKLVCGRDIFVLTPEAVITIVDALLKCNFASTNDSGYDLKVYLRSLEHWLSRLSRPRRAF